MRAIDTVNKEMTSQHLEPTHLLHGELLEDGVILVEPKSAQPVQDAVLLGGIGLGRARCL